MFYSLLILFQSLAYAWFAGNLILSSLWDVLHIERQRGAMVGVTAFWVGESVLSDCDGSFGHLNKKSAVNIKHGPTQHVCRCKARV
jgi:hypothetical protein